MYLTGKTLSSLRWSKTTQCDIVHTLVTRNVRQCQTRESPIQKVKKHTN